MLNIKPIGTKIIATPIAPPPPANGIVLPENVRESHGNARFWKVCDVGPGVKEVRAGDTILSHSFTEGSRLIEDGSNRSILREESVILVLRDEPQTVESQPVPQNENPRD